MQFPITKEKLWFTDIEISIQNEQIKSKLKIDTLLSREIQDLKFDYDEHERYIITSCVAQ